MEKVFLSVLNMSLTASFIIAVIMLARLPLKKAPKIISYALWAVAGFRLMFPFPIESMFSLLPFKAAPIPQNIAMQAVPRIDSGVVVIDSAVSAAIPGASVNPMQVWLGMGTYLWIFGIAIMLIYSLVSIVLLKNRLRNAVRVGGNLYETVNLKTPFVIGLFRPRIFIPGDLSDEERRYIVLHEETHIRRHDHAVKMFAYFVLCLHWFNPMVWIAFFLMGADMEMSCDERVLKEMGEDIKIAYSLSLVRVAAGRKILNGSPLAFGEGGMKERVKNVLNFKKHSRIIIIAAVIFAVVLSVGFAVNKIGYDQSQLQKITGATDEQAEQIEAHLAQYGVSYQSQLKTYLSDLFTEAYSPHYDGLHYAMIDYAETVEASDYTATFFWTMHHKGNGLDIPGDSGKEQAANFSLKATAKLVSAGLLDFDTIKVLADSSTTGAANYAIPIEDFFPQN